jgi:flavin reductase (DIM6/NTAB) family NADH-FMN oxidoreductase RutF
MTNATEKDGMGAAIGRIPSGLFILTARYEDKSTGMLASWVQQVSFEPPMVSVAVAKARPIMLLISDSSSFGLCQLPQGEKIIMRKFASGVDASEDPFLGFDLVQDTALNVPILSHAMSYLECEVVCHMDVDGDHDLFVGKVKAGAFHEGEPWVHLRDNGFKY